MRIIQHETLKHFTRIVLLMGLLKGAAINNLYSVKHYYNIVTKNNFVFENICIYDIYIVKGIPLNIFSLSLACSEERIWAPNGVAQSTET